jgi:DNA polymerase III alpha subunit (gram-positive type)
MRPDLLDSQRRLQESLFDLYMIGGLESVTLARRGMKRELIIDLETSGLTSDTGEIIRYRAINRWDSEDEFDEWAKPMATLSPDAARIVGVTNEQLVGCRPSKVVLEAFVAYSI